MRTIAANAASAFKRQFDANPEAVAVAPGRLELLGNHTDYNEGLVLGLAIDRYVAVAGRRSGRPGVRIFSSSYDQSVEFTPKAIARDKEFRWANYPKGVIGQFVAAGHGLGGFDLCIESNVPLGAGVSSSAALLVATALCVKALFSIEMDPMRTARLCHAAERDFAGANNGLLDHFCSLFGKANHVLYLDCRSLEYEIAPVHATGFALVVSQTNVRHSIVEGEYQVRRRQCTDATAWFSARKPGIKALRDVSLADLDEFGAAMDGDLLKRARHIVGENDRVARGKALLAKGDLASFGQLLYESHESSRINFENSCPELDAMVEIAKSVPGVFGSRLTGGGFGGCTLTLLQQGSVSGFEESVREEYPARAGKIPDVFVCNIADGGRIISI